MATAKSALTGACSYLTAAHEAAPLTVTSGSSTFTLRALTRRDDAPARLPAFGVYAHCTAPGDAPLGYTEWAQAQATYTTDAGESVTFDYYHREPDGTAEEIAAALVTQRRAGTRCTRLQARLALIDAGMWSAVTAYFADPSRTDAEVAFFEDASNWERLDPTLTAGATALGLDDAALDALFTAALEY
jgi:hypothetical protein